MAQPLAEVVRSGFVEGVHYGSAVVLAADGTVEWSLGDVNAPIYPRSANKLMQGLAMVRTGLPLKDALLALACASHSGEEMHVDGARRILAAADLTESELQCPPDWPLDSVERDSLIAAGGEPERIYMNCSGKHAAMLFTCVLRGWDTARYLQPDHPLQEAVRHAIEDCAGERVAHIGVDGCGAPLMAISLTGLARSFGKFAGPTADDDQAKIANAIRNYPEHLSGTRRPDAALMRSVPGLLGKIGAEGVYAIGLADGRALALKVSDGADRAAQVAAAGILRRVMGVVSATVEEQMEQQLHGGGRVVGQVRCAVN